jgi:hypothetical protein
VGDELIAFWRARLDEDEAAASAAAHADGKYGGRAHWSALGHGIAVDADDPDWGVFDLSPFTDADEVCAHVIRHDPARELRDVQADRAILDYCVKALSYPANVPLANLARRVLAARVAVWSDHPDYRLEWKP